MFYVVVFMYMKPIVVVTLFILNVATQLCVASDTAPRIYMEEMDDEQPHVVPTFPRVGTSLIFPAPIDKWIGSGFTYTPDKQQGDYQVEWKAGDILLTLSPVMEPSFRSTKLEERVPRNMNIFCQGKLIVVEVIMAESRSEAASCVKFVDQLPEGYKRHNKVQTSISDTRPTETVEASDIAASTEATPTPKPTPTATPAPSAAVTAWEKAVSKKQTTHQDVAVTEKSSDTVQSQALPSPATVTALPIVSSTSAQPVEMVKQEPVPTGPSATNSSSALLELISAAAILKDEELRAALQALPSLECSTRELTASDGSDYGAFATGITRVIRDNRSNAVGLAFNIQNKTANTLSLQQASLVVRIGDAFYPQPKVQLPPTLLGRASYTGVVVLDGLAPDTDISQPIRASIEARAGSAPGEKKRGSKKESPPKR